MEIVKGHIIPKYNQKNDELRYFTRFTQESANALYKRYIEFLKKYTALYTQLMHLRNGKNKLTTSNHIKEFLNALIFYIKSFTTLDVVPEGLLSDNRSLPPSSSSLLRCYPFIDNWKDLFNGNLADSIKTLEKRLTDQFNKLEDINRILNELMWKEDKNILEFPADTRPGYNTSSLLLHMLTVSAIATAIYQYRYRDGNINYDMQVLRLVSLFHDIGKMSDWHNHETISSQVLLDTLEEFCEGEALEIVKKSSDIIKRKDKDNELYKIFKHADKFASSLDRMSSLLPKFMRNNWKKIEEKARSKGYGNNYLDNWKFWSEFSIDEIIEFTEEFCINASKISSDNPAFNISNNSHTLTNDILTNEVIVARLDFQSIQSYINSSKIRVMNGASRMVDIITTVLIPFYLVKKQDLAAESILYYGGGNITLVLPNNAIDKLNNCKEYFRRSDVKLNYGYSLLYNNLARINHEIDVSLAEHKLIKSNETYCISPNIGARCVSCGSKEVSDTHAEWNEKTRSMCSSCITKCKIGDEYHFKKRIKALKLAEDNDTQLEQLLENILEYIAGHTIEEIKKKDIDEYKNIAYIKIDGNLMGQFMASSISISDAYERSVRIDGSLKRAFHEFLYKLNALSTNNSSKEYIKRIIMGIMYMGGDDAALIVPTTIALPLSIFMIDGYYHNMGKKSTLSIGIATAKPKHSIQLLKESSEYLLDEKAKDKKIREYAYSVHSSSDAMIDFRGALSFWAADGGSLSEEALNYMVSSLSEQGLSSQPYIITGNISNNVNESIYKLLEIIRYVYGSSDTNYVNILLNMLDDSSIDIAQVYKERLLRIRNELLSTLQVNIDGRSDIILKIVFASKEKNAKGGGKSEDTKIHALLLNLLRINAKGNENEYVMPLYDLYQLMKVMGIE